MAVKVYVLLAMLVFAGIVSPIAHAQLGLIGNILNTLVSISGSVPCNVENPFSTSNNVFPNAAVQLRCGGTVVASTTTNSTGRFLIVTASPLNSLEGLLRNCNIVVITPLVSCNASLPTIGNLVSGLTFVDNTISGLVANLFALNFAIVLGITN